MIDIVTMVTVFFAGLLLGGFFFGGLLWTVNRGISSKHPAILFLGSSLIRTAAVLFSFWLLSAGRWERMLICLAGFFIARVVLLFFTRTGPKSGGKKREVADAA